VGTLPDLVSLREAVLKKAGYRVVNAFNEAEALAKIYSGDCGVLLLCYSVEDESRKQIAKTFREVCPEGRIVLITNSHWTSHLMPTWSFTESMVPKR
jgi:DNA-binding NarL/FixJ family response regulator